MGRTGRARRDGQSKQRPSVQRRPLARPRKDSLGMSENVGAMGGALPAADSALRSVGNARHARLHRRLPPSGRSAAPDPPPLRKSAARGPRPLLRLRRPGAGIPGGGLRRRRLRRHLPPRPGHPPRQLPQRARLQDGRPQLPGRLRARGRQRVPPPVRNPAHQLRMSVPGVLRRQHGRRRQRRAPQPAGARLHPGRGLFPTPHRRVRKRPGHPGQKRPQDQAGAPAEGLRRRPHGGLPAAPAAGGRRRLRRPPAEGARHRPLRPEGAAAARGAPADARGGAAAQGHGGGRPGGPGGPRADGVRPGRARLRDGGGGPRGRRDASARRSPFERVSAAGRSRQDRAEEKDQALCARQISHRAGAGAAAVVSGPLSICRDV
mmetsp:Transcript_36553/g.85451  ORF Transcript_36553/g.85451 Transcript_36553/m.85451 type:complete len:377 (-) Transcript_36553:282-1412(-)